MATYDPIQDYLFNRSRLASLVTKSNVNSELYLSCVTGVENLLQDLHLKQSEKPVYILTVASDKLMIEPKHRGMVESHVYFELDDHHRVQIHHLFHRALKYIHSAMQIPEAVVIVHCFAGMSRSASFVLAYLMKRDNLSFDEAYTLLKSKRPIIEPNSGFIEQLKTWASQNDVNLDDSSDESSSKEDDSDLM